MPTLVHLIFNHTIAFMRVSIIDQVLFLLILLPCSLLLLKLYILQHRSRMETNSKTAVTDNYANTCTTHQSEDQDQYTESTSQLVVNHEGREESFNWNCSQPSTTPSTDGPIHMIQFLKCSDKEALSHLSLLQSQHPPNKFPSFLLPYLDIKVRWIVITNCFFFKKQCPFFNPTRLAYNLLDSYRN